MSHLKKKNIKAIPQIKVKIFFISGFISWEQPNSFQLKMFHLGEEGAGGKEAISLSQNDAENFRTVLTFYSFPSFSSMQFYEQFSKI